MKLIHVVGGFAVTSLLLANTVVLLRVDQVQQEVKTIEREVKAVQTEVKEIKKVVLYSSKERIKVSAKDMDCLARNIFHEAGIEDRAGKIAVAQVTLNRLKTGRWGNSICSVVYAKAQFSWTLYKSKRWAKPKGPLWNESLAVAQEFVKKGKRVRGLEDSTYYHAEYVDPAWNRHVVKIQQIGQHIFYKMVDT